MLLYDWGKIFSTADGNPRICLQIVKMMTYKEVPKNKYDPIYSFAQKDFSGSSFLVHPDLLVYNAYRYPSRDIAIYLAMASLRSVADYKISGKTTVDIISCPLNPFEHLEDEQSRLLYVEGDALHFLYEEVPTEKNQWH
jgi:hypothetical protein